jgi:hypothetical protein
MESLLSGMCLLLLLLGGAVLWLFGLVVHLVNRVATLSDEVETLRRRSDPADLGCGGLLVAGVVLVGLLVVAGAWLR